MSKSLSRYYHKIQENFIAKADFYSKLSDEEKVKFKEEASQYAKRRKSYARSIDSRLKQKKSNAHRARTIEMVESKTGKIVKEFFSVKEASEALSLQRAHIRRVIRGERKSWRGYVFRYKG